MAANGQRVGEPAGVVEVIYREPEGADDRYAGAIVVVRGEVRAAGGAAEVVEELGEPGDELAEVPDDGGRQSVERAVMGGVVGRSELFGGLVDVLVSVARIIVDDHDGVLVIKRVVVKAIGSRPAVY